MMDVMRNSDGSGQCHTLSVEIGGKLHPVVDYSHYDDAQQIADQINKTGFVIHATEFNPMLYTTGKIENDKFEPYKDFSDFNKAVEWCSSQS